MGIFTDKEPGFPPFSSVRPDGQIVVDGAPLGGDKERWGIRVLKLNEQGLPEKFVVDAKGTTRFSLVSGVVGRNHRSIDLLESSPRIVALLP